MEYNDYIADANTQEIIPQETWREKRARLEDAYDNAEQEFFLHRDKISYLYISPLPEVSRHELLRCNSHRWKAAATHYQTTPYPLLLCTPCAKELKRVRRKEWLARKRWRDGFKSREIMRVGKIPASK